MAQAGRTGATVAPAEIIELLRGAQGRQNTSDSLGRRSAPPKDPIEKVPPNVKLNQKLGDPSDEVLMFTGDKITQDIIDRAKKAGFTTFRKDIDRGDGRPVPRIFFKKKLDIKARGGSL